MDTDTAPRPTIVTAPALTPASPDWWIQLQKNAWNDYTSLPWPTRKNQDWRFASLQKLPSTPRIHRPEPGEAAVSLSHDLARIPFPTTATMHFAHAALASGTTLPDDLAAQGVIFLPLHEAVRQHPDLVQAYFMKHRLDLGSSKFEALHAACADAGYFLSVPKNVEVKLPFVFTCALGSGSPALFPHGIIVTGENSRVTVFEHISSVEGSGAFVSAHRDVFAGSGASVHLTSTQTLSDDATTFQAISSFVDKDASCRSLQVNLGASFVRSENRSRLAGSGARSEMLALAIADGSQEVDQRTLQDHIAPNGWSDLLYKNALNHRARTIFQGLIKVEKGASGTDAYQTNHNLILCPEAEADSLPGLEILNDDVKCSHGATTGQVDPEQLYYLLSRGIPPQAAHHLLVVGFFDDVLARLEEPAVSEFLIEQIEAKFSRSEKLSITPTSVTSEDDTDPTEVHGLQGTV